MAIPINTNSPTPSHSSNTRSVADKVTEDNRSYEPKANDDRATISGAGQGLNQADRASGSGLGQSQAQKMAGEITAIFANNSAQALDVQAKNIDGSAGALLEPAA